jgi:uncharacterized protein (DUF1015 family)
MSRIRPFKAIRPSEDKVGLVASRSYEDYSAEERKAVLKFNPFSFLHILNPGFKFNKTISGKERFKMVHNRYEEFLESGVFTQDSTACYYLYRIHYEGGVSTGLFAATPVEDYQNGLIRKHEETIQKREDLFASYLETVGFNAEPVLLTYPDDPELKQLLSQQSKAAPLYDFSCNQGHRHQLWPIADQNVQQQITLAFERIPALYIADGHHRCASSALLAEKNQAKPDSNTGSFMSYLIPESDIRIYSFSRLVRDLGGMSKKEFLIALDESFRISQPLSGLEYPKQKQVFGMYLEGEFYLLTLRKNALPKVPGLGTLDSFILYKTILEPLLGISDLRKDKRIEYGKEKENLFLAKEKVDKGEFSVAFILKAVDFDQLKEIADQSLRMPPKSTYIEPKLLSGLAIYEL